MHPTKIKGWSGSLKELAYEMENLRYDKVLEFLFHLSEAFIERSKKDKRAGRKKLHEMLENVISHLDCAYMEMQEVLKICVANESKNEETK